LCKRCHEKNHCDSKNIVELNQQSQVFSQALEPDIIDPRSQVECDDNSVDEDQRCECHFHLEGKLLWVVAIAGQRVVKKRIRAFGIASIKITSPAPDRTSRMSEH